VGLATTDLTEVSGDLQEGDLVAIITATRQSTTGAGGFPGGGGFGGGGFPGGGFPGGGRPFGD